MNSTTTVPTTPCLSLEQFAELRAVGLQELYSIRSQAMKQALEELQGVLQDTQQGPDVSPPWRPSISQFGFTRDASLESPQVWELLRAHLAARTAVHMAGHDFGNGVTGYSMARHIAADLNALALDGWAGLTAHGLSTIGGSVNV